MKTSRARSGPFRSRLHYTQEEIDRLAEDELQSVGLLPSSPAAINIDRYVEKRFFTPTYSDELPPTLLGFTEFGPSGPIEIVLNAQLASDPSPVAKRRVRTTIAHEAGHALLHAVLYLPTGQVTLLPEPAEQPRIPCKEQDFTRTSYDGKWWEYQANLAMSSLLLPRTLTTAALRDYVMTAALGATTLPIQHRQMAITDLSAIFDVNPVVAKIRIEHLFPVV